MQCPGEEHKHQKERTTERALRPGAQGRGDGKGPGRGEQAEVAGRQVNPGTPLAGHTQVTGPGPRRPPRPQGRARTLGWSVDPDEEGWRKEQHRKAVFPRESGSLGTRLRSGAVEGRSAIRSPARQQEGVQGD